MRQYILPTSPSTKQLSSIFSFLNIVNLILTQHILVLYRLYVRAFFTLWIDDIIHELYISYVSLANDFSCETLWFFCWRLGCYLLLLKPILIMEFLFLHTHPLSYLYILFNFYHEIIIYVYIYRYGHLMDVWCRKLSNFRSSFDVVIVGGTSPKQENFYKQAKNIA